MAVRKSPYSHYDDPERAEKIHLDYAPEIALLTEKGVTRADEALKNNNDCEDLDIALDRITRDSQDSSVSRTGGGSPHYNQNDPDGNGWLANSMKSLEELNGRDVIWI